VGSRIYISPDKLAKLPEDEYYWHELLGLVVETESGQNLGWIHAIIPGAGHDVYACFDGKREILLPAVAEVIRKVDVAAGVMVVRLPKGL
jgi:16S rRNA processing protein RimM